MKPTNPTALALKVLRLNQGLGLPVATVARDSGLSVADAFAALETLLALPSTPVSKRWNGDVDLYTLAD